MEYLAHGDWHRTLQVGPAIWYAGTPESGRARGPEQGTALPVEIERPGASSFVSPLVTSTYRWVIRLCALLWARDQRQKARAILEKATK